MRTQHRSPVPMLVFAIAAGLNVAFIAFFALWYAADTQAVNAAETTSGFDQSSLLPNSDFLWIAAHTSLALVIALDVCLVLLWRTSRRDHSAERRGE
ncbi:hypothetical protein M3147_09490 [Agromyces mediolanus]|uniref:hypothetical protein n=1 Tax=Agromyces mediolanus TaxID=41986 RepID=UPI0020423E44|nr:hypothetical protein [Agromyces mediolanus]MCM3657482.1 hypothetical protein [Agromyces mediolanus]